MRFTAFFCIANIVSVSGVTLCQMTVGAKPDSFTAIAAHPSTPALTTGNSTSQNRATVKQTVLISQQSRIQRIEFAPGAVNAVVEDSVVRGDRVIYLLRASKSQTMTLNITSLDQNAVFDVQAPNGKFLQEEVTNWSGVLPATGDYSVIVSGTRGNATYKLEFTIE